MKVPDNLITPSRDVVLDFLNNEDTRRLFVGVSTAGTVLLSNSKFPDSVKSLVFLKASHVGKVKKDNMEESVMFFDLSR